MARQKPKPTEMSIHSCFESSVSGIEDLRDEMDEWRDNIQEYFSETEKFERVSEAAEALYEAHSALENWGSSVEEIDKFNKELMETVITVSQFTYTRRGLARWRRLSNCLAAIEAAKDWLEEYLDKARKEDQVLPDEVKSAIEELIRLHDEAESHLSDVDFPTMFG